MNAKSDVRGVRRWEKYEREGDAARERTAGRYRDLHVGELEQVCSLLFAVHSVPGLLWGGGSIYTHGNAILHLKLKLTEKILSNIESHLVSVSITSSTSKSL